jgi:hypothetical protein
MQDERWCFPSAGRSGAITVSASRCHGELCKGDSHDDNDRFGSSKILSLVTDVAPSPPVGGLELVRWLDGGPWRVTVVAGDPLRT